MPSPSPSAPPPAQVHDQTPADGLAWLRAQPTQPLPRRLLMCPPDHFAVVDVKNPHMEGNVGAIDRTRAAAQWRFVAAAFRDSGAEVETIEPLAECEDMVFCANQTLIGLDAGGRRTCALSHMRHESRRREVPAFGRWFAAAGYRVEELPGNALFEGSGDAIWHPGRALIWGGYGHRTDPEIYAHVSTLFGAPVLRLRLTSEHFYHLDTCFCAIDERTVLIDPRSIAPEGVAMIRALFEDVIECPPEEALRGLACNATPIGGEHVVIQAGNPNTTGALRERGFQVHEVDTSEFLKSGGSVFCMKMYVF